MKYVQQILFENKDEKYAEFQRKLIPVIDPNTVIGVRTPLLKAIAKQLIQKPEACESFLNEVAHKYFDENQLHAFIISENKDFERCIKETELFLPRVNNWATCDQMSPKVFAKNKDKLLSHIRVWIASTHTYTVRFGVGMLMQHFLGIDFKPQYIELVMAIKSREYYINMEIAWYMATALAKQWDATIPYLENCEMDAWTHNRSIQKALESRRITAEQKKYLKTLKK